jgi:uncharacterized protein YodC (DUF2158 family)
MAKLVRLRSGGSDMEVIGWSRQGYTCKWDEDGKQLQRVFPRSALLTVYRLWFTAI